MSSDEKLVLEYLEKFPGIFISPMEVSKRAAGRNRFKAQPEWARATLHRLAQQNVLDCNEYGHYCIKPQTQTKAEVRKPHRQPMAPKRSEDEDDRPFSTILRKFGRD
jgi:hypothetical protein